jgi:hypothetical protein
MKLLKSNFSRHIDFNHGKLLFNGAISAIRRISVMDHDRPVRLADILSQMWNATGPMAAEEDGLQLKVRCRMSMSHVYDTVWRWRQRFRPGKTVEEIQGTTVPTSSLSGSTTNVQSLAAAAANQPMSTVNGLPVPDNSLDNPGLMIPTQFDESGAFFSEAGFSEVFDSLNWVFDGIPDSSFAPVVL